MSNLVLLLSLLALSAASQPNCTGDDCDSFVCGYANETNQSVVLVKSQVCDGEVDCPDGGDEVNCSTLLPCQPGEVNCSAPANITGDADDEAFGDQDDDVDDAVDDDEADDSGCSSDVDCLDPLSAKCVNRKCSACQSNEECSVLVNGAKLPECVNGSCVPCTIISCPEEKPVCDELGTLACKECVAEGLVGGQRRFNVGCPGVAPPFTGVCRNYSCDSACIERDVDDYNIGCHGGKLCYQDNCYSCEENGPRDEPANETNYRQCNDPERPFCINKRCQGLSAFATLNPLKVYDHPDGNAGPHHQCLDQSHQAEFDPEKQCIKGYHCDYHSHTCKGSLCYSDSECGGSQYCRSPDFVFEFLSPLLQRLQLPGHCQVIYESAASVTEWSAFAAVVLLLVASS